MFIPNSQLLTDSYKVTHWKQLRPGTKRIYSYMTSRGGMFPYVVWNGLHPKLVFLFQFLQYSNLKDAENVWAAHFGRAVYNKESWEAIHKLGYLPLSIKAVPEGTIVPTQAPLFTVENTHDDFAWLTNWVEPILMHTWYPTTVATLSRAMKIRFKEFLELTGCSLDGLDFKVHDFGFRGVTCPEQAAIGGAAHLINFKGTDTAVAMAFLRFYYGAVISSQTGECPGYSVPAAEHSTITSWGRAKEPEAYDNMLEQFPDGIIAVVSDSYNIYTACRDIWGDKLKVKVLDRDGTLVIRPDSGDPKTVVVKCLNILGERFGYTTNDKGYRLLNPKVRIIQGDGMSYPEMYYVLDHMRHNNWAADNVTFGIGGALLQQLNRDTQKMALKCSATLIGDKWEDVSKDPITDTGKRSKAGRLALIKNEKGKLETVPGPHKDDILQEVFRDGKVLVYPTLAEMRERTTI